MSTQRRIMNVAINGRRTSIGMEQAFWEGLTLVARKDGVSIDEVIGQVANKATNQRATLTSQLRVHILENIKEMAEQQ